MGRFWTADPSSDNIEFGIPITWNHFTYVHGDPINFYDPAGLADSPSDSEGRDCDGLVDLMKRYLYGSKDNKGIIQRVYEQIYGRIAPGETGWDTHNDQIEQRQQSLRDVLDEWNTDNCGDGPNTPPPIPNVWKWATRGGVTQDEYIGPAKPYGPMTIPAIARPVLFAIEYVALAMDNMVASSKAAAAAVSTAAAAAVPSVTSRIMFTGFVP